jgi:hypothetical protein
MVQLLNFALYQVGWFACVLGAAYGEASWGVAVAMSLVGLHMLLTTDRINQAKLLFVSASVGLVVDIALLRIGVYQFPSASLLDGLPPLWMSALWIQFATTFRYCMRWLSGRYAVCGVLGLAGAPAAFLGGERLGAVAFCAPRVTNVLILGSLWAIAIPLLIYLSDKIHAKAVAEASYRGLSSAEGARKSDRRA